MSGVNTVGVKHAAFRIKQAGDEDGLKPGAFVGYASVFGNVDSYGDIVEPGAFADTLEALKAKGDPIPLLWGHDMFDPFSNIGSIDPTKAVEDERGLRVEGELDLTNPTAEQVYKLLKGRRVTDMSFAYRVLEERKANDGNHLLKLDLLEVSVVPIGANSETDIMAIKSRLNDLGLKAGRVLSAANEGRLNEATAKILEGLNSIESVLASVATGADTILADTGGTPGSPIADGKASGTHEDKEAPAEEPSPETGPVKAATATEDQKAAPSVDTLAALWAYTSTFTDN